MTPKTNFDTANTALSELFYTFMNDIGVGHAWPGYDVQHAEILAAHGWTGPDYDVALAEFAAVDSQMLGCDW